MTEIIAPYILAREYRCRCCDALPPDFYPQDIAMPFSILFEGFALIREAYGKPLIICSGYRCPVHNALVGGESMSVHLFGLALDINLPDVKSVYQLDSICEDLIHDFRRGAYTKGQSFLHIDCGYMIYPRGSEKWYRGARWSG